jgi:uncharacterized protein
MKYLLLIAVVFVVLWAMRRAALPPPPSPPRQPSPPKLEAMVRCSHCGLHLPRSEALLDTEGKPYCSVQHRIAGPRQV